MNDLEKFSAHLKSFTVEVQEKAIAEIILKHEAEIVDLNIGQMMAGKMADGSDIEPEYTPLTVAIKKSKGQVFDRVTLRDEGTFQQKMHLEGTMFPIDVNSADLKTGKLVDKYGEKIFGFSAESKQTIAQEVVKQDVQEYYKSIITL